jgi:hypothetical protein
MVRAGSKYGKDLYLMNPWGEIELVAVFENSGFVEPWVLKALSPHERRSEWVRCSVPEALGAIGQCLV